ncbi:hypothetical protein [Alkalihalobacterium chitinilyticum]|uniref:Uncharacterized protein n=1 Tax=Alkalihalobacterium chitinilyticum TaxID=2980103 RepID=A0ABT5VJZ5_9BACI|nr:hypothetical protein [Alkalihalobacterium chitinilyticum]MDE5415605.1 hypothetical protein [Alkalihalobacterium chitinilyticum]
MEQMVEEINSLRSAVISLKDMVRIEEITKGFSQDKKYKVTLEDGQMLLLRTASLEDYERKSAEFRIMREVNKCGVLSPDPIDIRKFRKYIDAYQSCGITVKNDDKIPWPLSNKMSNVAAK